MVFTIKTDDEVAGLDITNALSVAGIKHTIVSKQNDNAAQHSAHPTYGELPTSDVWTTPEGLPAPVVRLDPPISG